MRNIKKKKMLCLLPIGEVEPYVLEHLIPALSRTFSLPCASLKAVRIPSEAYNSKRRQYNSEVILSKMYAHRPPQAKRLLGITEVDLYVSPLNFVFGQADPAEGVALISLCRLHQEYYGLPADKALFLLRTAKEAVHELGHTYGLRHCYNLKCVMHFSNSLRDTDIKSESFCKRCRRELEDNLQRLRSPKR